MATSSTYDHRMAELANAIFEVFATLLRAIGFVGSPRQRAAIREDLALLRELEEFPRDEFGPGTRPHAWLADHINRQIAEFSGIDLRTSRRAIPWSSVVISIMIWAPLGWLTY